MNTDSGKLNSDSGNPEKVFTLNRNERSCSTRMGVHVEPKWAFILGRNMHSVYYQPIGVTDEDLRLMRLIDEVHLKRPFYGSRRIRDNLQDLGHSVNRKKVQRLMRLMGIRALYPKANSSRAGTREMF